MFYAYFAAVLISILEFLIFLLISDKKPFFHSMAFFLFATLSCVTNLLLVQSQTPEEAVFSLRLDYMCSCILTVIVLMMLFEMCKVDLPKWARFILYLSAVSMAALALLTQTHLPNGYEIQTIYKSVGIDVINGITIPYKEYGFAHLYFKIFLIGFPGFGIAAFIYALVKHKQFSLKNAVFTLIFFLITMGSYFVRALLPVPYELTPFAVIISGAVLLVITYRATMYNVEEIMVSSISKQQNSGYLFFDKKFRFLGCTEVAEGFLPMVSNLKVDYAVNPGKNQDMANIIKQLETFDGSDNSFVFTCGEYAIRSIVSYTYHGDRQTGFLVELRDDTNQQTYIKMINQTSENKSNFLSNVSHEIRTPINSVLGMNEMILRECKDEQILEYADNINTSGKTLLQLINDILDLSKIESGKLEIFPDNFELKAMLLDVENMIAPLASHKNLEFKIDASKDLHNKVYGDCVRIKQILVNILNNAVKYTDTGSILFTVSEEGDGENTVFAFAVKDTGHGIKEENIAGLFSAYERIDGKKNAGIEGTGLGLSITKRFIEIMGGHIEVESEYGVGSTFTAYVPMAVKGDDTIGDFREQKVTKPSGSTYKESFHAPDANILVVDDTATNLTVVKALLKKTLLKVDTAASGQECLDAMEKKHFDLVLLDHMMPGMDGVATLAHIRENPEFESIPIVALTANAIGNARERYISLGFNDYLSKPIDSESLEEKLLTYLPKEKVERLMD